MRIKRLSHAICYSYGTDNKWNKTFVFPGNSCTDTDNQNCDDREKLKKKQKELHLKQQATVQWLQAEFQ